jgi:hypothetical protein
MRLLLLLKCTLFGSLILQAQDDIYDQPEPVKPRIIYQNPPNNAGDGSYENLDDSYNPEFDYRYRRSLRRMYDPYYVMPSSAFINMYSYPQFANFYNPYWGSGLVISVGNGWNDPWGWNNGWNTWGGGWNSWGNPYGWNSWNSWNAWNNPWGWNNGWNTWGGGWNNGWNNGWRGGWNNGNRNSVNPPERRISRAVRVMDPDRDYGNTRYRPSQNQSNTNRNPSPNTNTPVFRGSQGTSSPSPTLNPSPTRMGNMNSGSNSSGGTKSSGGSSGGGSGRSGRSGGGSRF